MTTRPSVFMLTALALSVLATSLPVQAQSPAPACPPAGYDRARLLQMKAEGFTVADDARRNTLALGLLDCLADPDPELRDGVAYEALTRFLRGKALTVETRAEVRDRLVADLQAPEGPGFRRPFAALVLAEVARTDRTEPWLTATERGRLVAAATSYVRGVADYRGFDEREGWRHGVAHGADLLAELAANPHVGREDLGRILEAVASQIAPNGHPYVYGEPERLARPVLLMARRGIFTEAEWTAWLARACGPAPLASWGEAYRSQAGLAKRHNTMAFLSSLYLNARIAGTPD
ncbi:MAG TPA: DUF2785 domain-containing protein, partial [Thermoanaerobaculia bacterium]|nr:DUF2785 domain-containing protein [Thermoanaerobaculia bacterium]